MEEKPSFYDEVKYEWDMHSAGDLVMFLGDLNGHIHCWLPTKVMYPTNSTKCFSWLTRSTSILLIGTFRYIMDTLVGILIDSTGFIKVMALVRRIWKE